jgi:hypothetical protein
VRFRSRPFATDQTANPNESTSQNRIFEGADDGIRTHTPLLAKTDFKSVASTIPPHRLLPRGIVSSLFAHENEFRYARVARRGKEVLKLCFQIVKRDEAVGFNNLPLRRSKTTQRPSYS